MIFRTMLFGRMDTAMTTSLLYVPGMITRCPFISPSYPVLATSFAVIIFAFEILDCSILAVF